jgi:predicted PurR-regulated permease PerM
MDNLKKMNQVLLFTALLFLFLYFGRSFLIPFIFGIFFAMLVNPLSIFLEKNLGFKRIFSSLTCTFLIFIAAGGIMFLFIYQINYFFSDISSSQDKIDSFIRSIQEQITSVTNLSEREQNQIWQERSQDLMGSVQSYVTGFFGSIFSALGNFLLMLIYVFLLLLYRDKFSDFVMMYTKDAKEDEIKGMLHKTGGVVYQYLLGRLKVMALLGILYIITFLIFGLPYAVLLTLFGTLITVIPYLGPLVSGLLPILFAAIFFDSMQKVILFASIVLVIQLIESYVFEPLIMGKQVQLNPLIVIIAIIIGGMVWGLAGMILFVPLFAMFKIVSFHITGLKPVGYLVGNSGEEQKEE